ncbi:protein adenylyltransferase FICD [Parasteatoda tepidariorum]|uniref:protein adenylyltransferase FICD n=1 Tax=Parasteatoda tepidariorum TaxID=114398 RepID=UPI001C71BE7F|nr:protein adenylyltransferase Fic [Parasteatoda tepidariorum]
MNGIMAYITRKVVEYAGLSQGLFFNLYSHRCGKTTLCVFSISFILAFTALFIIVSLSYWHPTFYKYYEHKDQQDKFSYKHKLLEEDDDSYVYTSNLELRLYENQYPVDSSDPAPYNGNNIFSSSRKRDDSTLFLPDESDIAVTEDLIQINKVPVIRRSQRNQAKGTENEALSAVQMALKMKQSNKFEKAQKLFHHALALQPLHPDVLNHYGEFVEEREKDFIKADQMFFRALTVSPEHSRALVNRKRTSPLVNELDEKELKRIDKKHIELIKLNHNNPSLNRLKKELYFQHIYHTVAIEGNTMSLEDTRMVIETGLPVNGKSLTEHMEVVGVESALRYIDKQLVTKDVITVFDILEVHKLVLGHVKPLIGGSFRQSQVFVAEHTPPRASELAYLMQEFVEWLQSYEFLQLHPVKQAALAHYKLVYIHPFVDGNGRTARLIMNMILMRYGYPPVIIRNNERNYYFRTLQLANEGDVRPFVRFIAHCTECTLNVYLHANDYSSKCLMALEPISFDNNDIIVL